VALFRKYFIVEDFNLIAFIDNKTVLARIILIFSYLALYYLQILLTNS